MAPHAVAAARPRRLCSSRHRGASPAVPRRPSRRRSRYAPPVDAPVVDPFRPPADAVRPGQPRPRVRHRARHARCGPRPTATVAFAGPVAGTPHVTVLHADGVRTTLLVPGDASTSRRGSAVAAGRRRRAPPAGALHFGARSGDAYLDPAVAVRRRAAAGAPRAVRRRRRAPAAPASAARSPAARRARRRRPERRRRPGAAGRRGAAPGRRRAPTAAAAAPRHVPGASSPALRRWRRRSWTGGDGRPRTAPPAERRRRRRHPARRVAVLVAGLGSSSDGAAIDDARHRRARLRRRRRRPLLLRRRPHRPIPPTALDRRCPTAYDAGRHAAATCDVAAAPPGRRSRGAWPRPRPACPIDVLAHSQGGVVARLALVELERRHGATRLERSGIVVTLGTPARRRRPRHRGRTARRAAPTGGAGRSTSVAAASAWRSTPTPPSVAPAGARRPTWSPSSRDTPLPDGVDVGVDRRPRRPRRAGAAQPRCAGRRRTSSCRSTGSSAHDDLPGCDARPPGSSALALAGLAARLPSPSSTPLGRRRRAERHQPRREDARRRRRSLGRARPACGLLA